MQAPCEKLHRHKHISADKWGDYEKGNTRTPQTDVLMLQTWDQKNDPYGQEKVVLVHMLQKTAFATQKVLCSCANENEVL